MRSDYVDNWEALPEPLQEALEPIIGKFDQAADLLFDRRLSLSFEAAVKELSVPGIVALTDGLRRLHELLITRVTVVNAAEGALCFDSMLAVTAYDLPLYTPCLYLSQLAQYQEEQNVRVWKSRTAEEIVRILLVMAGYIRPDIETARVTIAALHDMAYLYPESTPLLAEEQKEPNARVIAQTALQMVQRSSR